VPRVSIVIPVRNQAAYLPASLASAFEQPYRDAEVIVVDDGSTDDVEAAVAPFRPSVRLERQPPLGVAAASNRGAALARGELLAFHDADDLMERGRLTIPLAVLDADPALALVFGNGVEIDATGEPLGPVIPARQARRLRRRGVGLPDLLRRSLIYVQASLIRRSVFEALGGFRPFPAGADWGLAIRCALHHPVAFVDAPLFRYRRHPASLTAARLATARASVDVLEDVIAREPGLLAALGRRTVERALARRVARLAAQLARAGDDRGARDQLRRACVLAPWVVKYRLRLWRMQANGRRADPS